MLTYATLDDFKVAKQVKNIIPSASGVSAERLAEAEEKINDYLARATRYINRFTRREFFPYKQTRRYPVPHKFLDLQLRRFLTADLYLDEDLLDVLILQNGTVNDSALVRDTDYFFNVSNIYPIQSIELKFPNFWGGAYEVGILSRTFNEPIIEVNGIWGYHDKYPRADEAWVDTLETIPLGGILATDTSFIATDPNGTDRLGMQRFQAGYMIMVDQRTEDTPEDIEFIEVTGVDTDTNTVSFIRGVRGTAPMDLIEGGRIMRWRVVEDIVEACLQIAKTWRESDTAAGGRLGVSDISAGVEIGIPADPLNVIKMYQKSFVGVL